MGAWRICCVARAVAGPCRCAVGGVQSPGEAPRPAGRPGAWADRRTPSAEIPWPSTARRADGGATRRAARDSGAPTEQPPSSVLWRRSGSRRRASWAQDARRPPPPTWGLRRPPSLTRRLRRRRLAPQGRRGLKLPLRWRRRGRQDPSCRDRPACRPPPPLMPGCPPRRLAGTPTVVPRPRQRRPRFALRRVSWRAWRTHGPRR